MLKESYLIEFAETKHQIFSSSMHFELLELIDPYAMESYIPRNRSKSHEERF
jgi:hypothetical protein